MRKQPHDAQPYEDRYNVLAERLFWKALALPSVLLLLSWGIIGFAFLTGWNILIDHDYLLNSGRLPWLAAFAIFLGSWQVMLLAMMLPSLLPSLAVLYNTAHKKPKRAQLLFLAGYTCLWTIFALLAFVGDTFVHEIVRSWFWLYLHAQLIGSCTLALAGLIQCSPLKQYCLQSCKISTDGEILSSSWRRGWRYGRWCLGSNWALMLLMFGIGMRSIVAMALLALLMLAEREMPMRRVWLRLGSGNFLLMLALLWYVFPFLSHL